MNYGLYLSASGVLTNLHRQDVIANNLANASTTGFKRQLAAIQQRRSEALENGDWSDFNPLLDRIGGGAFAHRTDSDFSEGPVRKTDNDLDLAIHGRGFFVIADAKGQPQLSRDGRFTMDPTGMLVHQATGRAVLDVNGQPIRLNPGQTTTIDEAGRIRQGDRVIDRIDVVDLPDKTAFSPAGSGLLRVGAEAWSQRRPATARLQQGYLEQSNVEPIREMVAMIEATRAITANANMIRYHDVVMDRAVNTLGRVS